MEFNSKLPSVGTTIFTVMSGLATKAKAINLGQGFPDFPMNAVQPSERFHFIVRHLDIGHTPGETVNDIVRRAQRRELLSQKLTCVHLLEFVRVERLVSTGVRFPAPFNGSGDGFGAGVGTASVFNFRRVFGSSSSFE